MNIQERLTAFSMLGAGWVMWLLVGLSVVSIAIILERIYYFFSTRDQIDRLSEEVRAKLAAGDFEGAGKRLEASPSWEARIVRAGLEMIPQGVSSVEERLLGLRLTAKGKLERNLAFLGTVGSNAPFVGLLGTVIGIIRSFQALNESQGQVSTGLMAEIGEALVATAIGLLVALPAVAAYNGFQRVIKARLNDADILSRDLLAYAKAEKSGK